MRLTFARPDMTWYDDLFDLPGAAGSMSVTFLGVTSLLVTDGTTALMTDGFFTRPPLWRVVLSRVGLGRLRPNPAAVRRGFELVNVTRLAAVVPVHCHYDHALDSAYVARISEARLVGGRSTANIGRGHGLPTQQIMVLEPGQEAAFGDWKLRLLVSEHCPPDRFPGSIRRPLRTPARVSAWRCGEAWSVHVTHATGRSMLVQGSAGFVPGALAGTSADVVYLGVGQLGLQSAEYIAAYWRESVTQVGARRAVLTHWDNLSGPLYLHPDYQLRPMRDAFDALDRTLAILQQLAATDLVRLSMPRTCTPADLPPTPGWVCPSNGVSGGSHLVTGFRFEGCARRVGMAKAFWVAGFPLHERLSRVS